MLGINIPHIAFGCLAKPLAAAFAARASGAGLCSRDEFGSRFEHFSTVRPQSRSLMEGFFDGNASFNASRYRCY
jgi:hypothetical protein